MEYGGSSVSIETQACHNYPRWCFSSNKLRRRDIFRFEWKLMCHTMPLSVCWNMHRQIIVNNRILNGHSDLAKIISQYAHMLNEQRLFSASLLKHAYTANWRIRKRLKINGFLYSRIIIIIFATFCPSVLLQTTDKMSLIASQVTKKMRSGEKMKVNNNLCAMFANHFLSYPLSFAMLFLWYSRAHGCFSLRSDATHNNKWL